MKNSPQVEAVLAWQCNKVVSRISKKCGLSIDDASQAFADVKLFLFVSRMEQKSLKPTLKIDMAWHEFLVYTKEYREFCLDVLGAFIDHCPTDDEELNVGSPVSLALCASRYVGTLSNNWAAEGSPTDCVSCFGQPDPGEKDECSSKVFASQIGEFHKMESAERMS